MTCGGSQSRAWSVRQAEGICGFQKGHFGKVDPNLTGEDGALGRFEFVAACEAGKTCQLQFLFIGREEFSMVVCPTRWDMESKDRCQR